MVPTDLTRDEKYLKIKGAMGQIMDALGLDQSDDSLAETPHRVAKMYVDEIFGGLDYSRFPKITAIDNSMQCHEMVKVSEIELVSTCEHHFITIDGFARVAYVPIAASLASRRSTAWCVSLRNAPRCRSD